MLQVIRMTYFNRSGGGRDATWLFRGSCGCRDVMVIARCVLFGAKIGFAARKGCVRDDQLDRDHLTLGGSSSIFRDRAGDVR